jgi:uncharacterized ParB-like nuclease family protein
VSSNLRSVRIDSIVCDTSKVQVRNHTDAGTVERYRHAYKAGVDMPPVKVAVVLGTPYLFDGFHRIEALKALGKLTVLAEVHENVSPHQLIWLAYQMNLTHGLPLKASEIRRGFIAYINAGQHRKGERGLKSLREIGREFGKDHKTIMGWLDRQFPKLASKYRGAEHQRRFEGPPLRATLSGPKEEALLHFQNGVAAARGVTDPGDLEELIQQLEASIQKMRQPAPYQFDPENTDF